MRKHFPKVNQVISVGFGAKNSRREKITTSCNIGYNFNWMSFAISLPIFKSYSEGELNSNEFDCNSRVIDNFC